MLTQLVTVIVIVASGIASQYAPGVMEGVIVTRQAGLTAHTLPDPLPDVDCASDNTTREWMRAGGVLVEVDAETAQRWDTVGRGAHIEIVRRVTMKRWRCE